jgi:phage terminase large subunit-like protein
VVSVAYDRRAATQLAQRLTAERVPMVEFRANTQNFSEPTKELDAAMRAHRIEHDAHAILDRIVHNAHRIALKGESMRKPRTAA